MSIMIIFNKIHCVKIFIQIVCHYHFQSMIQNVWMRLDKLKLYNFDKKDKLYHDSIISILQAVYACHF
jgi:hypothetical protein